MKTLLEILWEFIKATGGLILVTLTAPLWGPYYLFESMFGKCDDSSRKIKIALQIVFTLITSLLYIYVIISMFTDPVSTTRGDEYYERQYYYEHRNEPGW